MQVRSIEFQESFARVPVEQARQQHVLQREPDLASDLAGRVVANDRLLDQSRPVPPKQAEGGIVDLEQPPQPQPKNSRRERGRQKPAGRDPMTEGTQNTSRHIDLFA